MIHFFRYFLKFLWDPRPIWTAHFSKFGGASKGESTEFLPGNLTAQDYSPAFGGEITASSQGIP